AGLNAIELFRLGPPAGVLLASVFATLALRRRTLRAVQNDPQAVWFGFLRMLKRIKLARWLGWFAAVSLCNTSALVLYALDGASFALTYAGYVAFFLVPPALAG